MGTSDYSEIVVSLKCTLPEPFHHSCGSKNTHSNEIKRPLSQLMLFAKNTVSCNTYDKGGQKGF